MKLPFMFKNKEIKHHPWQWSSCKHSKTLSFQASGKMFKTVNSVFFDHADRVKTPESWSTNSFETASYSTESEDFDGELLEMVVRGARSERLFFEPGGTSSILEEAKINVFPFKECMVLAMDSEDPYVDFRRSMEEMVESHGLRDWEGLEELLAWYLRVNGKNNHGYIVRAFVDLIVEFSSSTTTSCSADSTSYASAVSSFSSSASALSSPLTASTSLIMLFPFYSVPISSGTENKSDDGSSIRIQRHQHWE